jgi:uncharacterized protein YhfF
LIYLVIHEDKSHFGWDGDNGIGERLIQQIIAGTKTATCAPKVSYEPDELGATYASVGKVLTVMDKFDTPRCNIRILNVFETTFGNPDHRLVKGEGDEDNVEKFKRDHINASKGMAAEGIPLTDGTILIVEMFELVEDSE